MRRLLLLALARPAWDGLGNAGSGVFAGQSGPKVKVAAPQKVSISAGIAVGLLIQKTAPIYPPIAKNARVSGTVVIQATISKTGTIENLRVVSGPAMLRQAALDAVKTWRFRPYMLDGQPVEVETTVNVIFCSGRMTSPLAPSRFLGRVNGGTVDEYPLPMEGRMWNC